MEEYTHKAWQGDEKNAGEKQERRGKPDGGEAEHPARSQAPNFWCKPRQGTPMGVSWPAYQASLA